MIDEAEMKVVPEPRQGGLRELSSRLRALGETGAGPTETILDWRHFVRNLRLTAAPTKAELDRMIREQARRLWTFHGITTTSAAAAVDLARSTLRDTINGRSPTYSTLIKATAALGIDLTVTMPGELLPAPPASGHITDAQTLLSRAPSFEALQEMVRSRLDFNGRHLSAREMAVRRQLPRYGIEELLQGKQPTYETLREMLAALHIDLVIRPAGEPLPEAMRYARFTEDKPYLPIIQLRDHDSTRSIDGRLIKNAPAPIDLDDAKDAFYGVWPHEADTQTGLRAGDYCLVAPNGTEQDHRLVWLQILDEAQSQMPARKTPQDNTRIAESGKALHLRTLVWRETQNACTREILTTPYSKLKRQAPIVAAYDGRPKTKRPPAKRDLRQCWRPQASHTQHDAHAG